MEASYVIIPGKKGYEITAIMPDGSRRVLNRLKDEEMAVRRLRVLQDQARAANLQRLFGQVRSSG